ncbi:MAG TPA: nucleotide exchange factor GrpE [Kiritimatiellia bacterium]|nr:nucleotide exchange factor GrpE [Kiritimatiellia bacterium]
MTTEPKEDDCPELEDVSGLNDPNSGPEAAAGGDAEAKPEPASPEVAALNDRLLRLQADFDNFRRRTLRERDAWALRANEELLKELLPVLDHFELGLKTAAEHEADDAVQQGFALVFEQFKAAVKKFGVEPVDPEGEAFDPHVHEAVTHQPSAEVPADSVVTVFRKGYRLGERLIRPAQVVVSSGPSES